MLVFLSFVFIEAKSFFVPCPVKWLTGVDCPGCGFQRSVWALIEGDFAKSFELYPPTLFFLLSFTAAISVYLLKLNIEAKLLKMLYFATGIVVVINYLFKLLML
ncbi:DUF2752 domain-containing protein [Pedobacter insulae]|uniref:DUF2752 domain-containing protein n=1 Tax=Pedobacter insulae TaxID=414048 RepID=A0A1I2T9M9_9SPHI|nr:Protein of unknown function [Pedobacter insulae]